MNKPVYLGLSMLELSKILMNEFWYGFIKPNMVKKQNCTMRIYIYIYIYIYIFILYIKRRRYL